MKTPQDHIQSAAHAISTAVMVLKMEMPTIEAFLKECRDMENVGPIVDPTLYIKNAAAIRLDRKLLEAALPLWKWGAPSVAPVVKNVDVPLTAANLEAHRGEQASEYQAFGCDGGQEVPRDR